MVLPALRIAALALLFLLTSLHAVDPYSELSYRTFLSLSAKNIPPNNPTSVEVSVVATYLNFSFYSELEKDKVRAIADTSHLFQPDTFTKNDRYSGVFLYNNSTLAFTFNGNDIVDSGGHTICNPVYTNAQGKASCIIEFFRNPDPNDPTPVPFSSLPSCGYVRVKAPEKFIGSTLYQSGSATITVCPKNNLAISAFGPAIISAFDPGSPQGLQNLAICFPSLLIAGILMASMYYSGRDPLSLFDITTPRLPKGQTFKIKAGATPQMLRQVLRRYAMLKKQAKADTEKLFVKLVKMSSEYQNASLTGKIGLAMAAKRQARAFYNDLEKATRLTKATGGIQTLQLNDKKRQLGEMMRNVSGLDKDSWDRKKKQRWGTMTNMAFHSFNIFTMAENARRTMGAARGPTGKGNLFSRQVNKFMEKAGDGVVSLEGTPVMRFLGKVPLVRKVVAIPGKAVDVSLGWIAAKRGIKSVARELKGGAIFMAGQTKLGRPIYDSVKKGFLDKEGKDTKFGKFTTWLTGWNFGQFEGRHDLSKIKLQSFQNVFHQNVLVALAAHNREYLELVAALGGDRIERERQRSIKDKEETGKELKNKIKVLTDSLTGTISRSKDPKAISKLEKALHALEEIKSHPSYKKLDSESIKTLGDKIRNFLTQTNALRANQKDEIRGILKRMEDAAALENSKNTLIKNINGSDTTQKMALMELHKRYADAIKETKENPKERAKREKDAALLLEKINEFGRAEKIFGLFGKMNGEDIPLFRLQDGKYRLLDRNAIKTDVEIGLSRDELERRYGKSAISHFGIYESLYSVRTANGGRELRDAVAALKSAIQSSSLPADEKARLSLVASKISEQWGAKGKLGEKERQAIVSALSDIQKLPFFAKYDSAYKRLQEFVLGGGTDRLHGIYQNISAALNSRIDPRKDNGREVASKMSVLGSTPASILLTQFLEQKGVKRELLYDAKGERIITDTRLWEILCNPGFGVKLSADFRAELERAFGKNANEAIKEANRYYIQNAVYWLSRQHALESLMAGKPLTLDQARAALFGKGSIMKEINHANSERGILRQEMGFSEYDLGKHVKDKKQKAELQALGRAMDRDFSIGRVLEKLSGQVVGGTRSVNESGTDKKGLSAGENILGLYKQTLEGNRDLLNRYSVLFYNLVDSRSQLYDKGFADSIRKNEALAKKLGLLDSSGKPLDANTSRLAAGADGRPSFIGLEAYNALMERGFRFTDLKRGLSINMRSEGGAVPMIEWKPEFLKAKGKDGTFVDRGGIWLKADENNGGKTYVPELGGVYARTPGSFYSTRPTGASLLINVNGKWQYGDPNKAWMGQVYGVAEKQIGLRQNISLALVGFDEKASKAAGLDAKNKAFDPSQATYRVIPTSHLVANSKSDWKGIFKPLTYSNKTDSDIFDSLSRSDLLRGKLRSGLYTAGMGLGEWMNSSLIHRMDRMNAWYDAQLQVRLALKARADETGSWMTSGKERYRIGTETIDEEGKKGQSALDAVFHKGKESLLESSGISPSKSETVESKLRNAAARLEHGDDTMLGNMRAAYYNWKRNISQQTLSEIAGEEAKWYSAKTTLAALEKTGKNGLGLTSSQYERLHDNLSSQVDGFKAAYKEAKKDYGAISKMEIGWIGSHGNIYTPQRNLMTMGPLSYLLGSRYVAGSFQDFYNIVESSVMRDPRVAIGAGAPGFDWTFYVGYHTGQNVYERAHFWATNSIWERNMLMPLGLAYPIHKWWNDKVSFASRISSGYTSPIAGDMLYAPHHQQANYLAWAAFPFQSKTYSDFWRARRQSIVDFTGLGAAVGAFQATGSSTRGDENRGLLRTLLDRFGDTSEHYYDNPYRLSSMQRYDDQLSISKFKKAEQFFEKNKGNPDYKVEVDGRQKTLGEATELMQSAFDRGEEEKGQEYRKAIGDMLYGYLNAKDKRGVFVRNMFSGDDMASDGSRGRFLEMYCVFHSNVWNPTVPGMFTADPLTGEWHGFARNQRRVLEAPENSHLSKMANYYMPEIDLDTGKFKGMVNRFSTYEDAISQNYLEDTTALLQLAKRQNKALSYSAMNVMSTGFYNPFWGGLAKVGLKRLMSNTSWGSTLTDMPVKEGVYRGQENFDRLVGANTGYSFGELMPQGGHHGGHAGGSGGGDQWKKSGIRLKQQSNYIVRKAEGIKSFLERRINVWDEENNIYHQRKRRTTMKQTEETSSSYVGETYEALRPFLQDLDE